MNELSHDAKSVLDAGRAGLGPDDGARDRVRSAVLVRVGVAAAAGATLTVGTAGATAAAGAKLGSGVLAKLLLSVAIAGGVGTAGYVAATRSEAPQPVPAIDSAPVRTTAPRAERVKSVAAIPGSVQEVEIVAAAPPAPPTRVETSQPPAAEPAATSTLPAQLAHLRRANRALTEDDAGAALAEVRAYRRAFPAGDFRPELAAIEIDALCSLNRDGEAARIAVQFLEAWPASPLAERVRASCAQGGDQ